MKVEFLHEGVRYASLLEKAYQDALDFLDDDDVADIQDNLKDPKKTMETVTRLIANRNNAYRRGEYKTRFRTDCTGRAAMLWAALEKIETFGYRICIGLAEPKNHVHDISDIPVEKLQPNHVWVEFQGAVYEQSSGNLVVHSYLEGYFDDLGNYNSVKKKLEVKDGA